VAAEEVGRWSCEKCGESCVAVGTKSKTFKGTGAFIGPCPWGCGAWMNRAFRFIKPGAVTVYRSDEWDQMSSRNTPS